MKTTKSTDGDHMLSQNVGVYLLTYTIYFNFSTRQTDILPNESYLRKSYHRKKIGSFSRVLLPLFYLIVIHFGRLCLTELSHNIHLTYLFVSILKSYLIA